ncbi:hypothetical protein [Tenacibaculum sp. 190524A05c]|uniref:hypothetical protein n=1 Tax=Tenacibaculum platacis TaxID=3137852 RepID=UPI0032B2CE0D
MNLLRLTIALVLIALTACAQSPRVPTPPQTPNNSHTEVVTSGSRVSSSTSVSDSNGSYKFRSKFHSSKRDGVENILSDALDGIKLYRKNNKLEWEILQGGEVLFECSLNKNRLSIFVDKELSTGKFNKRIKNLGEELQAYISSHKRHSFNRRANTIARAENRLERAKRELQESIKNLEEVKRANEQ